MGRYEYDERQASQREQGAGRGRFRDDAGGDWYGGHGESWERREDFGVRGYRDHDEVVGGYGGPRDPEWRRQSPGPVSRQQQGYGRQHSGPIGRWPEESGDSSPRQAGANEAFRTLSGPGAGGAERGYREGGYAGPSRGPSERGQVGQSAAGMMGRGPHSGRGPKGYRRGDDRIREDICEVLYQHGEIDASEIEVQVQDGEVTLTGTVEDRWQKRAVEDALEQISGVRDVHNRLRVQPRYWQEGGPVQADQLATTGTAGDAAGGAQAATDAGNGASSGTAEPAASNARSASRGR